MMKREFVLRSGMWLLLLLCLSPFVFLAWFNWPASDDYFDWMYVQDNGFVGALSNYYHQWGGRYSSYVLVELLNPLQWGENTAMRWITFLQLGLFLLLSIRASHLIIPSTTSKQNRFIGAACLILFWWAYLPRPVELLYWFTGSMTYLPGLVGICFWYHFSQLKAKRNLLQQLGFLVLPFLIAGTNELNVLLLGLVISLEIYTAEDQRRGYIIPFIIFFIGAGIALLAPGNNGRSAFFESAVGLPVRDVAFTLKQSAQLAFESISFLLFKTPLLIIAFVIGLINPSNTPNKKRFALSLIAIIGVPFLLYAPFCFGTGQQQAPDRVHNVVFLVDSFLLLLFVPNLVPNNRLSVYAKECALAAGLVCILVPGNRVQSAWNDVEKASDYLNQHQSRVDYIEEVKTSYRPSLIRFSEFSSPPYTLFYGDLSSNSSDHFNQGYARYHGVKAVCVDSLSH